MASKKSRRTAEQNPNLQKALHILLGSGIGIALLFAALFGASAAALKNDLHGTVFSVLAYLCCALPALIGGFIAVRPLRKNGILFGALSGLPLCLVLVILCAVFYGQVSRNLGFAVLLVLFCGALGGIGAVNLRSKRRYSSRAIR